MNNFKKKIKIISKIIFERKIQNIFYDAKTRYNNK